ncbi:MAG: type VI secretion system ATPase TssH, partial [Acidobacteria bacterium ACB2]|nr:type VI secretion system ATPase TssH [Acidobacteria bacterium ACB2]
MSVNLKSLIGRLNDTSRAALEGAAGLCLSRTNYDVEVEHVLLKLLETPDTDLLKILRRFEIDASRLARDVTRALDRLKTGNARTPGLSPRLPKWIEKAWLVASIEFGAGKVRSGHLLLAALLDDDLGRLLRDVSKDLGGISAEALQKEFAKVVSGSAEDREAAAAAAAGPAGGPEVASGVPGKTKALEQYTEDLTAKARAGKIDPILGRDFEIRQVIDILTRRRQNNPILTG